MSVNIQNYYFFLGGGDTKTVFFLIKVMNDEDGYVSYVGLKGTIISYDPVVCLYSE